MGDWAFETSSVWQGEWGVYSLTVNLGLSTQRPAKEVLLIMIMPPLKTLIKFINGGRCRSVADRTDVVVTKL